MGSGGGFHAPAIRPVLPEINLGNFVLVFFLGVGPQKKFYSREYTRVVEPDFRTLRIKSKQSKLRVVLPPSNQAATKPIPKSINHSPVVIDTEPTMDRRKEIMTLGHEGRYRPTAVSR